MFARIVFLQGGAAAESLKILNERGKEACIEHLKQWDYGDQGLEFTESLGNGTADTVYHSGEYVLVYYSPLEYVGLSRIVEE